MDKKDLKLLVEPKFREMGPQALQVTLNLQGGIKEPIEAIKEKLCDREVCIKVGQCFLCLGLLVLFLIKN